MSHLSAAKLSGRQSELAAAAVPLLVMAGFFVIPEWPHRALFYVGCLPLLYYTFEKRAWHRLRDEPILLVGALYLLDLYLVELVLSGAAIGPALDLLRKGLLVLLFNLALYELIRRRSLSIDLLFGVFAFTAVLTGLAALVLYLFQAGGFIELFEDNRLVGFGRANHRVLGGVLAGAALLYFLAPPAPDRFAGKGMRILRWLAILLLVTFVLLTESRTALVALTAALAVLFVMRRRWLLLAVSLAGGVAIAVAYLVFGVEWGQLISRGDSGRLVIWENALRDIGERPLLGHGLAADPVFPNGRGEVFKSAHNLFLNTLYQGGIVALFLLLVPYGMVAVRWWKGARGPAFDFLLLLLLYGFVAGQFDFYSFLTNLNVEWVIYWIPVVLFVAESRNSTADVARRTATAARTPGAASVGELKGNHV